MSNWNAEAQARRMSAAPTCGRISTGTRRPSKPWAIAERAEVHDLRAVRVHAVDAFRSSMIFCRRSWPARSFSQANSGRLVFAIYSHDLSFRLWRLLWLSRHLVEPALNIIVSASAHKTIVFLNGGVLSKYAVRTIRTSFVVKATSDIVLAASLGLVHFRPIRKIVRAAREVVSRWLMTSSCYGAGPTLPGIFFRD
jgi:hypothetical protein